MTDSLIPPIGAVSQEERMFRVNWVANVTRSPSGVPLLRPDFVAKQGRRVRVIDVREADELVGVLGYLPGSDWVPAGRASMLSERIGPDDPVVLVSAGEERSAKIALELSRAGRRFVAVMMGGVVAWRDLGYSTTRDPEILEREGALREAEAPVAAPPEAVTAADVKRHVGDPHAVRWIKLPALLVRGLVSCVDGRDDAGVVGSPGGDAGELLVGLRAVELMTGRELGSADVATLLARKLDAYGHFYMHTDVAAANAAIEVMRADRRFDEALRGVDDALAWRRFWRTPPSQVRELLLDLALQPAHIGCGHLRLSLTRADDYETRAPLVRAVLSAFHTRRWAGAPEMELVPLAGGHTERAVLNVRIGGPLRAFSRIPLVSPSVGGAQVFVHHPRVTSYLRAQLAAFLAMQTDVIGRSLDEDALHREMERVGQAQLSRTLGALAKGLPIYDVTFHDEDRVEVSSAGVVG